MARPGRTEKVMKAMQLKDLTVGDSGTPSSPKALTDSERVSAWLGGPPLPRRYRWPVDAYLKADAWVFNGDIAHEKDDPTLRRKVLGMSELPFNWVLNLADLRGRRWMYKHQAHRNSFTVHMRRARVGDERSATLEARMEQNLQAARERMGEKAWHKMEYKRTKRNEKHERIAKRGEKRYG